MKKKVMLDITDTKITLIISSTKESIKKLITFLKKNNTISENLKIC